jgi:hypothetical protein
VELRLVVAIEDLRRAVEQTADDGKAVVRRAAGEVRLDERCRIVGIRPADADRLEDREPLSDALDSVVDPPLLHEDPAARAETRA